jgi:hypothetical protein
MKSAFFVGVILCTAFAAPAFAAPNVSFGDDSGNYTHDGECDDPRFEGPGMTSTALLSEDMLHDATDCQAAFDAGKLTLRGVADDGTVDFGDDTGSYSNDGECDDLRFTGPGMTTTTLIEDDVMHDATDCRAAYEAAKIKLHLK